MNNIRAVEFRPKVNEEAIGILENFLALAKAGAITDIAMFATEKDGAIRTGFSHTDDQIRRIAAASRLLHRLNLNADDGAVAP